MISVDGRRVAVEQGDTIASALYRAGVRTFSRSFKYHRPRGLTCLTGDCANCLVTVDGEPGVRACVMPARGGMKVLREGGVPSVDHDLLGVLDRLRPLLPVGFYYKALVRPRWLWPAVEPAVRRVAGRGTASLAAVPERRERRNVHCDVLVVGAGVAGLAAALAAAERGERVVLCDEAGLGERLPPGAVLERVRELATAVREAGVELLERAAATGVYEGPLVAVNAPGLLHVVHPRRVVVATGAVERYGVFPGSDLPGVWLGRGAALLAGRHGLAPGRRAVLVGESGEVDEHEAILRAAGVEVRRVAGVTEARGRREVREVRLPDGERVACDALVLSLGLRPRDGLLRQAAGLPVAAAGDAAMPGCSLAEAEAAGRRAGLGDPAPAYARPLPPAPASGIVCPCEDVTVDDLRRAWDEGFRSTELLKRYTTATMGPCQGCLCHDHLQTFVTERLGPEDVASAPTTARPPARPLSLEEAASGIRRAVEGRTALHGRHVALGARTQRYGFWRRPDTYGEPAAEYWAVRRDVSVMDVGTLGKLLVAGPDALEFLERLYPCRVGDLSPGRLRYALLLGEHGYVIDDGVVCALGEGRYYLTVSSGGATWIESWLRDWADAWGLDVHVVDRTAAHGAINVCGPRAREALARLTDEPLDGERFPYLQHRELDIAGVPCRALRLGFVGELSFELHHPSSRSAELWDALLEAGQDLGARPHGLEALRLLRLEKGHVIVGQDTDLDATPAKLGMPWAARLDKEFFLGKESLERIAGLPLQRRLAALTFKEAAPPEGAPLRAAGRHVGHLTSSAFSPVLGHGVALGWLQAVDGAFPTVVEAGGLIGRLADGPFYDPEGLRLRA